MPFYESPRKTKADHHVSREVSPVSAPGARADARQQIYPWDTIHDELLCYYSKKGRRLKLIRFMASLHILKHRFNVSDKQGRKRDKKRQLQQLANATQEKRGKVVNLFAIMKAIMSNQ